MESASLRDRDHLRVGERREFRRRDREDRGRCARGGPHGVVIQKRRVDDDREVGVVTDRRNAADVPPDCVAHPLGVGHRHPVGAEVGGHPRLGDVGRAARHDHHEVTVGVEDEAARDPCDVAPDGVGGGVSLARTGGPVGVEPRLVLRERLRESGLGVHIEFVGQRERRKQHVAEFVA